MNAISPYRIDLKDKILKVAMQEFFSKGIRAVKMDDIAKMISISKRTLYEVYADKESLLFAGLKAQEEQFTDTMARFAQEKGHNVIDILVEFYHQHLKYSRNISPVFHADLHKYAKVLAFLKDKRMERESKACDFFEEGVREGYFRKDINYRLAVLVSNKAMQQVMEEQIYRKYDFREIFQSYIFVFIRGLCTEEGQKILDKALEK